MRFEVESGGARYELEAPDEASAQAAIKKLMSEVKPRPGPGPLAAAAGPMQAAAGAADAGAPSVGQDIASSAGSRAVAGVLDVPGIPGDLGSLASDAGSWVAGGIQRLMGRSPEEIERNRRVADALTKGAVTLPGSEDVKHAVGFEAYEPKTAAGQAFDKTIGAGIEMAPGVLAGGGAKTIGKAAGDVAKFAMAPAIAGEAAGQATKGSALEPWARAGAMIATGGVAGMARPKVTGAKSIDELRAAKDNFYLEMEQAGVVMKPSSYDAAVDKITREMKFAENFDPDLHKGAAIVMKRLEERKGSPKTIEELDRLHQLAKEAMGSVDKREVRMAGILADKIDDMIERLKPSDLTGSIGNDPRAAVNALMKGRDAHRKMRSGERIANIIEGATDVTGANYSAAGAQTALRQAFKRFKWKGGVGKEYSREYKALSADGKQMVNSLIRGVSVENALRMIGKFNLKNPFVYALLGGLGVTLNPGALGVAAAAGVGSLARRLSANSTIGKAHALGEIVRGGQIAPRSRSLAPNSILYSLAARRAADEAEQGR